MRILLVDDSPRHRKAGIEQLTAIGHEVVALSDYTDALRLVKEEQFDAALLDLLMPAEGTMLGGEGLAHLGQPFPIGYPLAVLLAGYGVPLVSVATDTNHHNHPASAVMDYFRGSSHTINGSHVLFLHAPLKGDGVKDWAEVLRQLTIVSESE